MRPDRSTFDVLTLPSHVALLVVLASLTFGGLIGGGGLLIAFVVWQGSLFVELDHLGRIPDERRDLFWRVFAIELVLLVSWTALRLLGRLGLGLYEISGGLLPALGLFAIAGLGVVWLAWLILGAWIALTQGRILFEGLDLVEGDTVQSWTGERQLAAYFMSLWMLFNYGRVRDAVLDAYDAEPAG